MSCSCASELSLWPDQMDSITRRLTAPGLINNVLYVIILSSALDLVGPDVPKGVVLLADVIPSFLVKLCAPYFIHKIPYPIRIITFVALSTCGMLVIALTPALQDSRTIAIKMCGIVLASLSSGGGELSFLGLTHYYGHFALAFWGSGTGGAGLVGAGAYAIATTTLHIDPRTSLLAFSFLPVIMLISFFLVLPQEPLRHSNRKHIEYESIDNNDPSMPEDALPGDDTMQDPRDEHVGLLSSPPYSSVLTNAGSVDNSTINKAWQSFKTNLRRSQGLFFP
jgi:battenin